MRPTEGEQRWGTAGGILLVVAMLTVLPSRYTVPPRYLFPLLFAVALIVLFFAHPKRLSDRSARVRMWSLLLLYCLAATVAGSLGLLVHDIVSGRNTNAYDLLVGGGDIWVCNVLVFALVYWEYDRDGPAARARGEADMPDLLFPQMTDDHLARDWEPRFFDYLFVSFTCSSAFSPTDTMPLSRWCKALFTLQAMLAILTVTLVAARAVNILPGGSG
jgi:uncharacterized membrane protein